MIVLVNLADGRYWIQFENFSGRTLYEIIDGDWHITDGSDFLEKSEDPFRLKVKSIEWVDPGLPDIRMINSEKEHSSENSHLVSSGSGCLDTPVHPDSRDI